MNEKFKYVLKGLLALVIFYGCSIVTGLVAGFGLGFYIAFTGKELSAIETYATSPLFNAITTGLSDILAIIVCLLIMKFSKKEYKYNNKVTALSILFFVMFGIFLGNATDLTYTTSTGIKEAVNYMSSFMSNFWLSILVVGIIAPVAEELLFRGIMFENFRKGFPQVAAVIIAAAIFGLLHITGGLLYFVSTFIIGIFACIVVIKTNSIIYPMVIHITNNIMSVILFKIGYYNFNFSTMLIINIVSILITCGLTYILMKKFKKVK